MRSQDLLNDYLQSQICAETLHKKKKKKYSEHHTFQATWGYLNSQWAWHICTCHPQVQWVKVQRELLAYRLQILIEVMYKASYKRDIEYINSQALQC